MVERQLRRRGIFDERVLEAMGAVPRELFVPSRSARQAYDDGALAIGHEQTISQPWIVAAICQALALAGDEKVLEVGTGPVTRRRCSRGSPRRSFTSSGCRSSRREPRAAIEGLGVDNVEVIVGDGTAALAGAISVRRDRRPRHRARAAAELLSQLRPGGRLVVPIAGDGRTC